MIGLCCAFLLFAITLLFVDAFVSSLDASNSSSKRVTKKRSIHLQNTSYKWVFFFYSATKMDC